MFKGFCEQKVDGNFNVMNWPAAVLDKFQAFKKAYSSHLCLARLSLFATRLTSKTLQGTFGSKTMPHPSFSAFKCLLHLLVQIEGEKISIQAERPFMIDARQILSTRAFYWLPVKTGLEPSKVQNIRLISIVLYNVNFLLSEKHKIFSSTKVLLIQGRVKSTHEWPRVTSHRYIWLTS